MERGNGSGVRWTVRAIATALLLGLVAAHARSNIEGSDFTAFYRAGQAALEGGDIYEQRDPDGRGYLYPPTFAVVIAPLAALPEPVAAVVWVLLTLAAVAGALFLCLRTLGVRDRREAWLIGGGSLLCVVRPLDSELGNGQSNHWILFLLALTAWLFVGGRRLRAGAALALAVSLKLTPALLCAYFAYKREWRVLVGVGIGLVATLVVLPAAVWGPRGALEMEARWIRGDLLPLDLGADPTGEGPYKVPGYSLRSVVRRSLTHTIASTHTADLVFVNIASWSPARAEWIYRLLALSMVLAAAFAVGRARPRTPGRSFGEISIVVATMVLVAPLSRKAHFIVLLLPFAACLASVLRGRDRSALAWLLPAAVLLNLTSPGLLGKQGSVTALAYGLYFLGGFVLWCGLVWQGTSRTLRPIPTGERSPIRNAGPTVL